MVAPSRGAGAPLSRALPTLLVENTAKNFRSASATESRSIWRARWRPRRGAGHRGRVVDHAARRRIAAQRGAARLYHRGLTLRPSAQTPTGLPGCVLPRRADDLGSRNLGSHRRSGNPLNPVQFPKALLLKVTGPIAQHSAPARVTSQLPTRAHLPTIR